MTQRTTPKIDHSKSPAEPGEEPASAAPASMPPPPTAQQQGTPARRKQARKTSNCEKTPKAATKPPVSLAHVVTGYLSALADVGASTSTVAIYTSELARATAALGADTEIAALTVEAVRACLASDQVMLTRSGRERAKPTIDRARRALRLALTWARLQNLIEEVPFPNEL